MNNKHTLEKKSSTVRQTRLANNKAYILILKSLFPFRTLFQLSSTITLFKISGKAKEA
jgi:hypothetical protein